MTKLNVLIADDNKPFLKAFTYIIQESFKDRVNEIFHAENGIEAIKILKKNPVDIVFMDLDMPEMDGVEATKQAVSQFWGIKIIAVSFHSEFNEIRRMLEAGARNYIIKEEITQEILDKCLTKF